MNVERAVTWVTALLAVAISVLAYAVVYRRPSEGVVLAVLLSVVALPLLVVFGRLLLATRGRERRWV